MVADHMEFILRICSSEANIGAIIVNLRTANFGGRSELGQKFKVPELSEACTWSARAYFEEFPMAAVPLSVGAEDDACPRTKAVVAICVVFVSAVAVGARGIPDKVGELANTAAPVPVSSLRTPANWAEVVVAN